MRFTAVARGTGTGHPADAPSAADTATATSRRRRMSTARAAGVGAVAFAALGVGVVLGGAVVGAGAPSPSGAASAVAPTLLPTPTPPPTTAPPTTTPPTTAPPTTAPAPLGAPSPATAAPAATPEDDVAPPVRIAIPDLGIDQRLIGLRVGLDGALQAPARWMDIGWWSGGPAPGEPGGAVIAGHVNGGGEPAVFVDLATLAVGASVTINRSDGSQAAYQVTATQQFAKADFPDALVYTMDGPTRLHVVTCGGDFDDRTGHYVDNVVVFADLVSDTRTVPA